MVLSQIILDEDLPEGVAVDFRALCADIARLLEPGAAWDLQSRERQARALSSELARIYERVASGVVTVPLSEEAVAP